MFKLFSLPPDTDRARVYADRTRVYAIGFALVFPTVLTYAYFVHLADHPSSIQQLVYTAGKVLQFAFPLGWVVCLRRERLKLAGPTRRGLIEGLIFGVVIAATMLALYALVLRPGGFLAGTDQTVQEKLRDTGLDTMQKFIAAALFYSLIHSLLEEYYWRWFVLGELTEVGPAGPAIVISSLGFMAHHVIVLGTYLGWQSPLTYLFSSAIAIGGAAWAWIYQRTGTLYGVWISHLLVDAAIFVIGYDLAGEIL